MCEVSAKQSGGNCYEALLKRRSKDRNLSLMLHFLQVSSHRGGATCRLLRACVCVSDYARLFMCVCVFFCPGPRYTALIKPTAKRKTRPAAGSNDPEYTYGCFGENKWAENGIHRPSWYRGGRVDGGGVTELIQRSRKTNFTTKSGGENRIGYLSLHLCC